MNDTVLVVGESLIDIVRGAGEEAEVVGGSPANVALGLARLGVPVRFHSALGRDPRGERIAAHLTGAGVEVADESWSLARTSTAIADITPDGSARYTFDLVWSLPTMPRLAGAAALHVGSIAAFVAPGAAVVSRTVASAGRECLITFDPNIRAALVPDHADTVVRFERLAAAADVVKLSDEDAAWLYPGEPAETVMARILALGSRLVALTRGGSGALVANSETHCTVTAPVVSVRDTVGAGDTFMAALIAQVLRSREVLSSPNPDELHRVGRFAATAAAVTVQRAGADLPTEADVRALWHAGQSSPHPSR